VDQREVEHFNHSNESVPVFCAELIPALSNVSLRCGRVSARVALLMLLTVVDVESTGDAIWRKTFSLRERAV
jgi:hypothetical protein